jgi:hypothetical protein
MPYYRSFVSLRFDIVAIATYIFVSNFRENENCRFTLLSDQIESKIATEHVVLSIFGGTRITVGNKRMTGDKIDFFKINNKHSIGAPCSQKWACIGK